MNCSEVRRMLDAYVDGELDLIQKGEVETHLPGGSPHATATFDWQHPLTKPGQLLLFEAFVTDQREAETTRHIEDAPLAIAEFRRGMRSPETFQSSVTSDECMNLLGAALLRTGWSSDVALLSTPCLVIRPGDTD
jgi:hypothetical protein